MTRKVVLRPRARRDLTEIWNYTEREWSVDQAETYTRDLMSAIERLALQPGLGSDRSDVRPGLRKLMAGSHAIYYFHDDRVLRVSRILHVRMDVERAL